MCLTRRSRSFGIDKTPTFPVNKTLPRYSSRAVVHDVYFAEVRSCIFLSPTTAGDDVLENVAYARAHNSEQQMDLLKMASAMMAEDRCLPLSCECHCARVTRVLVYKKLSSIGERPRLSFVPSSS